MSEPIFTLIQQQKEEREIGQLLQYNEKSQHFGLALSLEQAKELMMYRNESLRKYQRVEFGKGILEELIFQFCDSQYINISNYLQTLEKLQDIFYLFKNETQEKMSDSELLNFMKEQFETVCFGDLEYLSTTCLARLSQAIRKGYGGHMGKDGQGILEDVDEEVRWDPDLYYQVLKEITWD